MTKKRHSTYLGMVTLYCLECGKKFERTRANYNRGLRQGVKLHFCNKSCGGRYRIRCCYKDRSKWNQTGRKTDELSPFRRTLIKCRARKRWPVEIDVQYIKELWDNQHGRCALSGIKLLGLPRCANKTIRVGGSRRPFSPSLDRIDSSKGYLRGNVQWVATIANLAKADFSEAELLRMCRGVVRRAKSKHTNY